MERRKSKGWDRDRLVIIILVASRECEKIVESILDAFVR